MLELHKYFPETKDAYQEFINSPTTKAASKLGYLITASQTTIDNKKNYFAHLFQLPMISEVDAVINAWAVAAMLEDSIPIAQKLMAVRDLFDDPFIPNEILDHWVEFIWKTKRIQQELLDFIGMDVKQSHRISDRIKKIVK